MENEEVIEKRCLLFGVIAGLVIALAVMFLRGTGSIPRTIMIGVCGGAAAGEIAAYILRSMIRNKVK